MRLTSLILSVLFCARKIAEYLGQLERGDKAVFTLDVITPE